MSHWIGLIILLKLASSLGSKILSLWTRKWKKKNGMKTHNDVLRRILTGTALFAALPIIGISFLTRSGLDTFWVFAISIIPIQFAYGIILPCYETLVNNYIPDTHAGERATIMSFASMFRSLFVMLLIIPSVGSNGGTTTVGWALPAAILVFCSVWGNFVLKRKQNKVEEFSID